MLPSPRETICGLKMVSASGRTKTIRSLPSLRPLSLPGYPQSFNKKEKQMDLQAKYDKAMDLLSRAENRMDAEAPDATWMEEYYVLTGDHMICTEEGWTPGENKPDIHPDDILMEVNAPQ